jgi:hypothetical protein
MIQIVWEKGRFSWPFVIGVIFVSVFVVVLDFVWRTVVVPVGELALYGSGAALAVAVGFLVLNLKIRRRSAS